MENVEVIRVVCVVDNVALFIYWMMLAQNIWKKLAKKNLWKHDVRLHWLNHDTNGWGNWLFILRAGANPDFFFKRGRGRGRSLRRKRGMMSNRMLDCMFIYIMNEHTHKNQYWNICFILVVIEHAHKSQTNTWICYKTRFLFSFPLFCFVTWFFKVQEWEGWLQI